MFNKEERSKYVNTEELIKEKKEILVEVAQAFNSGEPNVSFRVSGYRTDNQNENKNYGDNTYACVLAVLKDNREMLEEFLYVDEALKIMVEVAKTDLIWLQYVTFVFKD